MRLGFIGVGGQGASNVRSLTGHMFVAFADVNDAQAERVYREFPDVPRYRDYKQMLERHAHELDGVVVSTPDHSHYQIGMAVMQAGLNLYMEKPLAHTIWECRELAAAARRHGVKTQLGVQGHSAGALRILREWLDAGVIGPVREVYLWTDRMQPNRYTSADALPPAEPVPATLDWGLWQADRPERPFSSLYVPNRWRNWWDYGSGPLGDIGAHMFDVLEFALELGMPSLVEAETPWRNAITAPPWSRLRYEFPARGPCPPVVLHWSNGTRDGHFLRPETVPFLPPGEIEKHENAIVLVGDDGAALVPDMRATSAPRIFPTEREAAVLAKRPPATLPRPKGGHFEDWFRAIAANTEASAHFGYGAPLTEVVLLGVLAQRTGRPIRWDAAGMRALDAPEVDALVRPPGRATATPADQIPFTSPEPS
jgi:predicted dehydrogenase